MFCPSYLVSEVFFYEPLRLFLKYILQLRPLKVQQLNPEREIQISFVPKKRREINFLERQIRWTQKLIIHVVNFVPYYKTKP
jgi:hypothetical protein